MRFRDACAFLGLDPEEATLAEGKAAYRAAARGCHPDHGGDREAWDRLQLAWATLEKTLPERRRCVECGGAGFRVVMRSFKLESRACAACGGTGEYQKRKDQER